METTMLPEKWIKHLSDLPESGMGFQIVQVDFSDGKFIKSIVFNCSELTGDFKSIGRTVDEIKNIKV